MMFTRLRSTSIAGFGALMLVLALTGAAYGASVLTSAGEASATPLAAPLISETVGTFEDLDGDGVDDDCQSDVVPDPEAAAAAEAAVDLDGDGDISVSEAAQSSRTGGKNCNHGGYVSGVAHDTCELIGEAPEPVSKGESDEEETLVGLSEPSSGTGDPCDDAAAEALATECVETPAPVFDPEIFNGPGAFGAYVSTVAQSAAVGGKNCNHGGAVSDAVKEAKAAAKAERDAAKAAAKADREALKAQRKADREALKAERSAGKAH